MTFKRPNLRGYSKEDNYLIGKVLDQYEKYLTQNQPCSSYFLDEREFLLICQVLNKLNIPYEVDLKDSIYTKKIIYFGKKEQFYVCYRMKNINSSISHSDVLGSLFGISLSRNVIGDIYVEEDYIYFYVLKKVENIVDCDLKMISRYPVSLNKVEVINLKESHEELLVVTISSLRLDVLLCRIIPCSRSKVSSYLSNHLVLVNYKEMAKGDTFIHEGDIISIRSVGKYRVNSCKGYSKKGKIIVEIVKYR